MMNLFVVMNQWVDPQKYCLLLVLDDLLLLADGRAYATTLRLSLCRRLSSVTYVL